ncbi:MAG TPA: hypothetical protein VLT47_04870 [Anaeromyxobacteraceae bacterium]|nr:hypothetical protein [Anaeromyxobacteraceae bacterium]
MRLTIEKLLTAWLVLAPALAAGQAEPPPLDADALRRSLTLRADLGGTEPGTSRQAFEGALRYGGFDRLELQGGYAYTDQVYYRSNRGFLTAYRFYGDGDSYVKGDLTLRKYDYPVDPGVLRPTPDSNAYDWVPRGELEVQHVFAEPVRVGLAWQVFPANFFYDSSTWTVNQKVSGQLEVRPLPPLRLKVIAAVLRDPDPRRTEISGRVSPVTGVVAPRTDVVYRSTSLLGGAAAVVLDRVSAEVQVLPNRDLDNGYSWSLLSTVDLRATPWLDVRLQEVHDVYSSVSNYPGRTGEIYMGAAVFKLSEPLRLRGGLRWVDEPTRSGGTAIVGVEWRTGLL